MTTTILKKSIVLKASAEHVWKALTDPDQIRVYFFGTNTITDWKKGSPIFFRGEWDGKAYEDKGTILEIELNRFIRYNYWSSFSAKPDLPENYANITYEIETTEEQTLLTIAQDGFDSQEAYDHSMASWESVLKGMKTLVEQSS